MIKKKKRLVITLLIVISCFIYLRQNSTYTSYESEVEGRVEASVANWKIKVNNTLITGEETQAIDINTVEWKTDHTMEGTASPGTGGTITITIDPTTTGVPFDYTLSIIDHTVNPDKILTVTGVENTLSPLIKENNTYQGTMTLNDIKDKKTDTIKIHVFWDDGGQDIEVNPDEDTESIDMIEIDFRASQKK